MFLYSLKWLNRVRMLSDVQSNNVLNFSASFSLFCSLVLVMPSVLLGSLTSKFLKEKDFCTGLSSTLMGIVYKSAAS